MGTVNATESVGTVTEAVKVTFQTKGSHEKFDDGKKFTQAMASVAGISGVAQVTQWGEHVEGWEVGVEKEFKLKEAKPRNGLRCFTVLTGSGGGGWKGAPSIPTWDMSPDQAKSLIFAIWKGQAAAVAAEKPELAPDTVALVAATLTEKLWESAHVRIEKPTAGAAA